MSGEKDTIVNIRRSEYNRMMNTCRRVDNFDSSMRAKFNQSTNRLRDDLNSRFSSVNSRYNNIKQNISGLSNEMQRIEHEQNRQIQEHARRFQQGISSLSQELTEQRREYTNLINEQGKAFKRAMQIQQQELESQICQIKNSIMEKQESEKKIAMQWINDTEKYLDMINTNYRHMKFKPGELQRLQNEMELSQGDAKKGIYQASIATAQRTFIHASQLRNELEQMEMEWEAHLEAAKCSATEVVASCDAQDACKFTFETDEGSEEIAGEIDWWSNGALSEIREKARKELKQLGRHEDLSLNELKESMGRSEKWRNECKDLSELAKNAIIASQLRNNIGQSIEAALEESGWEITDAIYEGDDFRQSVHIKLKNLPGDEIVTIISPEHGVKNTIQNKVNISFFDRSSNDESFRQNRLNAIIDAFKKEGLDCTEPTCKPGTEKKPCSDERKLDFNQIKNKMAVLNK